MEPVDYRNETWDGLCARVGRLRLAVYLSLIMHGPCTTRELARRSGMDLLTVRPRVTELYQIGWVILADEDAPGREGVYRALAQAEARAVFEQRRVAAVGTPVQAEFSILI